MSIANSCSVYHIITTVEGSITQTTTYMDQLNVMSDSWWHLVGKLSTWNACFVSSPWRLDKIRSFERTNCKDKTNTAPVLGHSRSLASYLTYWHSMRLSHDSLFLTWGGAKGGSADGGEDSKRAHGYKVLSRRVKGEAAEVVFLIGEVRSEFVGARVQLVHDLWIWGRTLSDRICFLALCGIQSLNSSGR